MCKVVVDKPNEKVEFIIYNHLFSQNNYKFTVPQLMEELKQYTLDLPQEFVQHEVDSMIRLGLVNQSFKQYSVCNR